VFTGVAVMWSCVVSRLIAEDNRPGGVVMLAGKFL